MMIAALPARAQLTVVEGSAMAMTPEQLVANWLIGEGVAISNVTYNGSSLPISSNQIGTFVAEGPALGQLGIASGILMTSGQASLAIGPNSGNTGANTGGTGDPDLTIIAGTSTFDKCVLEFDFIPESDTIEFRYVFGSEEFYDYCSSINDAFGFFLSGPGITGPYSNSADNIALLPGGALPVTINNMCNDQTTNWCNQPNGNGFQNCPEVQGAYLQYDGFSYVFTAWHAVTPCSTYHIKLAIGDAVDHILDSGVFLEKNSFSSVGVTVNTSFSVPSLGERAIEGCSNATVSVVSPEAVSQPYTIYFTISGTAVNGVDYTQIPDSLVIPAGQTTASLIIQPLYDGITEGTETVILSFIQQGCTPNQTLNDTILIDDNTPFFVNAGGDDTICAGDSATLSGTGWGGQRPYEYTWEGITGHDSIVNVSPPPGIHQYILLVEEGCGVPERDTLELLVHPLPVPIFTFGESSVCPGIPGNVYTTDAGKLNYIWTIPPEATVTTGGTTGDNSVTLTWTTVGAPYPVSVNYTDPVTLCSGENPEIFEVTVNSLPVPVFIAGENSVCLNIAGNAYITEPGKLNYVWSIPPEATVTAGGGPNDDIIVLTWNTAGNFSIGINYTEPTTQCTAASASTFDVIVKPLPDPTITGESSVCLNIPGNVYTTQSGKSTYIWVVPLEATITAGGGLNDSTVTITWTSAGTYTVTVNYTEPTTQCTAANATGYSVLVNPLPTPAFTNGESSVCLNIPGQVYTAEPNKSNYIWAVPPEATITTGGGPGDNSITLTWNTVGNYSISVNYTEPSTQCTAATPTLFDVTVNALPDPTFISGENSVCLNIPDKIYTTQAGKTDYTWVVPPEATVTAGGGVNDNSVTLTWNTAGTYTVTVNYTESTTQCTAVNPASYQVTVNPLPVPIISGPAIACVNTPGPVYFTLAGMSGYTWTVNGGTPASGTTPDTLLVTWTSIGLNSITVNYTDLNGCRAATPSIFSVDVALLPVPTITNPPNSTCPDAITSFATQSGMSGYIWTVSPDGSFTGGGTDQIDITWTTTGLKEVTVNYQMGPGCTGAAPGSTSVMVNPRPVVINSITTDSICSAGTTGYILQADLAGSTFAWRAFSSSPSLSGFTSGSGENIIQSIVNSGYSIETATYRVAATANNCSGDSADFIVTVFPVADVLFDPTSQEICSGQTTGLVLQSNVAGATFSWTASASSPDISGYSDGSGDWIQQMLTNSVYMPGWATYQVAPTANGCFGTSNSAIVTVNPLPVVTFTACFDTITNVSAKPIWLSGGTPANGIYTGNSINGRLFYPGIAGAGTHEITYIYFNDFGCTDSSSLTIQVADPVSHICGDNLTDIRDDQSYPTVLIGTQCWMASNLNFGNVVGSSQMQRNNCLTEKYCLNDNPVNCSTYGGMYQWSEMMRYRSAEGEQGLCPPGWHVPGETEWNTLISIYISNGAGNALKYSGFSGFNALLEGIRFHNSVWKFQAVSSVLNSSLFWSSTLHGPEKAWAHGINDVPTNREYTPSVSFYPALRSNAFLVRCLKD